MKMFKISRYNICIMTYLKFCGCRIGQILRAARERKMFLENEKYNEWGCMAMGVFTVKIILYAIIAQS